MNLEQRGFTLIEMVIVMLVMGVMAFIVANVVQGPMRGFLQTQQRANLVDIAETALQRMSREVRLALPNSIRIDGGNAIEFLRTVDGGRYRRLPAPGPAGDVLNFSASFDQFDVLSPLNNLADLDFDNSATQPDCLSGVVDCLVIFNTGQAGANAYASDNIAALAGASATQLAFSFTGSGGATRFPFESPRQRFFVVDTPVSFICNTGTREIRRYSNYAIAAGQPSVGAPPGGADNLLVDQVTSCTFSYDPGTETRAGLVTLRLTIGDASLSQDVTLLQQAHVTNQP